MTKSIAALALLLSTGHLLTAAGPATGQSSYPNKPIRMISPYVPGGATTIMGRLVGQKLTDKWGQQVILDNRPGGGGVLGAQILAQSPPDGYTIIFMSVSDHILTSLVHKTPYDPIGDFAPIATIAIGERLMVINRSVPASNLQELIALAKSRPGALNYASNGSGTTPHLSTELFSMMAGVKMAHIPYKGGGQIVTDLIGGHVQVYIGAVASMVPFVNGDKLKAIAVSGENRSPALPNVPTFTEAGLPGLDLKVWYGVLAPARTPRAVIDAMSAEIAAILRLPDINEKFAGLGMAPFVTAPARITEMMKADMVRYARVVKAANIKAD